MRHLAWLDAVPEIKSQGKNAKPNTESRRDKFRRLSIVPTQLTMPETDAAFDYLLAYMRDEIGLAVPSANGPIPVSFTELQAWSSSTALDLSAWEILALKNLSKAYVSQYKTSSNPDEPAPFKPLTFDKKVLSNGITDFFAGLKAGNAERRRRKRAQK